MKVILSVLLLALSIIATAQIPKNALWVDASGKNTGNGSKSNPYKTISQALKGSKPNATIIIKKGIYRENVSIGKAVTLMGMPGERVVVSGMRKIINWKAVGKGIYKSSIDWNPSNLYVGFIEQPMARMPKDGWWLLSKKANDVLQSDKLKTVPAKLDGVQSYIWEQRGNRFYTIDMKLIDRQAGTAQFTIPNKWFKLQSGDRIYLKNHPSLISQPGEWAVEKAAAKFNLYFKPVKKSDLAKVEAPKTSRNVINIYNAKNVIISSLEVMGGTKHGISTMKCENVEIKNCLLHDNVQDGIFIRATKNSSIHNNLVTKNYSGISVLYSSNIKLENNEVGFNYMDGILITWNTKDVIVKNNYMHDHMLWGHPDNMQMYRNVKNVKIIDNLFITSGQALMVQETDNIEFKGNMLIGSIANQIILGHKNTNNVKIHSNTFAFSGYSPLAFTAQNYEVFKNIFVLGHSGMFYYYTKENKLSNGDNLYWAAPGRDGGIGFTKVFKSYKKFKEANPQEDKKSIYANPNFINAPEFFSVIDSKKITKCTKNKLYLRYGTRDFKLGDNIEINFDGIKRKVTGLDNDCLIITPGLVRKPTKPWLVANWKNNKDYKLNLKLKNSSPQTKSGSVIDIQKYKLGDFNEDGKRDIPVLPSDIKMPKY